MLFEGFAYIFFASLMFYMLVSKGKNIRLFILTIPIALIPYIQQSLYGGRGSIIFSIGIASIAYFILRRNEYMAMLMVAIFSIFFMANYDWFQMKWSCRIPVWKDMLFSLKDHPFIGVGFNHSLAIDNMMISKSWGRTWIFKHNDYLNLLQVLGTFAIIPIIMFIKEIWSNIKNSVYIIPVLTIAILCFVQATMCFGDRALVSICILALAVIESKKEGL